MNGTIDWLRVHIPDAFSKTGPEVDSLLIDFHGLLDEIYRRVFEPRKGMPLLPLETLQIEFYSLIPQRINELTRLYLPRECLMVAVDGVTTLTEMQALKQRSYYRSLNRTNEVVDRSGLLPGTDWMFTIKNQLSAFPTDAALRPAETIISHMTTPGSVLEKLLARIRSKRQQSHLIVCNDPERAHLLLLGALLQPVPIYLTIKGKEYIDVARIRAQLIADKGGAAPDEFVILSLLTGSMLNPGIPSLPSISSTIQNLYDAYVAFPDIFIAEDQGMRYVDWSIFARLLSTLSAVEPTRLAEIALRSANREYDYPFVIAEQGISRGKFYLNLFRAPWYKRALGSRDESLMMTLLPYINSVGGSASALMTQVQPVGATQVQDLASDYLVTLGWIYLFLQGGKVYRQWLYRYHHAPLCSDIALIAANADNIYLYGYRGIVPESKFHLMQQLSATLPYVSHDILPAEFRPLFEPDSPLFALTPTQFLIEYEGKRSPQEGVIIPFIEPKKVLLSWSINVVRTDASRIDEEGEYVYQLTASQLNLRKGLIESEVAARKLARERLDEKVEEQERFENQGRGRGRGAMRGGGSVGRGRGINPVAPVGRGTRPQVTSVVPKAPGLAARPKGVASVGRGSPNLTSSVAGRGGKAPAASSSPKASVSTVTATPKSPAVSSVPKSSATPKSPAVSATPKVSAVPKSSATPKSPAVSSVPKSSATPKSPAVSSVPKSSATPKSPAVSSVPKSSTVPKSPAVSSTTPKAVTKPKASAVPKSPAVSSATPKSSAAPKAVTKPKSSAALSSNTSAQQASNGGPSPTDENFSLENKREANSDQAQASESSTQTPLTRTFVQRIRETPE